MLAKLPETLKALDLTNCKKGSLNLETFEYLPVGLSILVLPASFDDENVINGLLQNGNYQQLQIHIGKGCDLIYRFLIIDIFWMINFMFLFIDQLYLIA